MVAQGYVPDHVDGGTVHSYRAVSCRIAVEIVGKWSLSRLLEAMQSHPSYNNEHDTFPTALPTTLSNKTALLSNMSIHTHHHLRRTTPPPTSNNHYIHDRLPRLFSGYSPPRSRLSMDSGTEEPLPLFRRRRRRKNRTQSQNPPKTQHKLLSCLRRANLRPCHIRTPHQRRHNHAPRTKPTPNCRLKPTPKLPNPPLLHPHHSRLHSQPTKPYG
jgi:hypothetical protein